MKQALEWGEAGTPPHHWDQLVAVRGSLCDLKHNLHTLFSKYWLFASILIMTKIIMADILVQICA